MEKSLPVCGQPDLLFLWSQGSASVFFSSDFVHLGQLPDWHSPWTAQKKENRKKWLAAGIVFNLFWLFLFKYSGFFAENLNILLTYLGLELLLPVCRLPLPIGISFYTFQAISYLADVYRKDASYEPSFIDYGMYITLSLIHI